jgi:DNA-binding NtrC family response regulator
MPNATELIGSSAHTQLLREHIATASGSDAKVLITGESGVGKEVVAQLIHHRSRRQQANLVTINCAGVPDSLLASELFGHVRGSFTDAYRDHQGWLEQAHRGTIFMDEVGEMSLQMQSLLLRFLENGEIQPVGSDRRTTAVDVRVIAATSRKLADRIAANEFREDLFYRLNVIHIEISPLRERRDDVPVLLDHFLTLFSTSHEVPCPRISKEAIDQLVAAPWPGNVRQLRNVAERLVVRAQQGVITTADLPRDVLPMGPQPVGLAQPSREIPELLFERMVRKGETFWTVVYEPFMERDLTRNDIRALVRHGLTLTGGTYKGVAQLFNVSGDYKRMLTFLRKFNCHVPVHEFRSVSSVSSLSGVSAVPTAASEPRILEIE